MDDDIISAPSSIAGKLKKALKRFLNSWKSSVSREKSRNSIAKQKKLKTFVTDSSAPEKPVVSNVVVEDVHNLSAIKLQKIVRGYLGRKHAATVWSAAFSVVESHWNDIVAKNNLERANMEMIARVRYTVIQNFCLHRPFS